MSLKSFMTGTHKASTLSKLTIIVTGYNKLNNIDTGNDISGNANAVSSNNSAGTTPGPTPAPANASPATKPTDKFAGGGWSIDDFRTLMHRYKCGMCRKNDHLWTSWDLFKNWKIDKKDTHPRPNDSDNQKTPKDENKSNKNKPTDNKSDSKGTTNKKVGSLAHVTTFCDDGSNVPQYTLDDDIHVIENTNPFAPLAPSPSPEPESVPPSQNVGKASHATHYIEPDTQVSVTKVCVFDHYIRMHMTNDVNNFINFTPGSNSWVSVGNHMLEVMGQGDTICKLHDKLV